MRIRAFISMLLLSMLTACSQPVYAQTWRELGPPGHELEGPVFAIDFNMPAIDARWDYGQVHARGDGLQTYISLVSTEEDQHAYVTIWPEGGEAAHWRIKLRVGQRRSVRVNDLTTAVAMTIRIELEKDGIVGISMHPADPAQFWHATPVPGEKTLTRLHRW